jgi:lysine-ketoglutarate reductase/saccharopine dehydrogenase-like protein (TIGR00300 family)
LDTLLAEVQVHGVNREDASDAELAPAPANGVLPTDFYSTTNLVTRVRVAGRWIQSGRPEMDCALVVEAEPSSSTRVRVVPMHRVRAGDQVVVGWRGVRVETPSRADDAEGFGFMTSEVSSEKPKAVSLARVAASIRDAGERRQRGSGGRVLVVCGPAVVHTGAAPALARLVRHGWIQLLFAGNGFATHDIESNVLGTSLGVSLGEGVLAEHGHANHLRIINEVRRFGSIAAAVDAGWLPGGVLYECVRAGVPFVLGGSVRDDGPLPDVISDTVAAADAMREHLDGVDVALMLATTLHAIATGNLLPAGVETYCVDINQAVVTKLADRGSHQALGIVTDVGLFMGDLADRLCGPETAS